MLINYIARLNEGDPKEAEPAPASPKQAGRDSGSKRADTVRRSAAGPADATLVSVAVRTAMVIRCVAVAYVIMQVGIWHSFYAAEPWHLAGPAVAVGWSAALVVRIARRQPATWLVAADSAVVVMLALTGVWWVPQLMRGDTSSWLYIMVAAQSVFPLWCAPLALAAPLVLASGAAYWAGTVFLATPLAPNSSPGASTALFLVVATVAWVGYLLLDRKAIGADTALAAADAAEHEHYVALRRSTARREHERLLHDTVLNTLTALARLGPAERAPDGAGVGDGDLREIVGRCRHDVALMEYVLGGSSDGAAARERGPNGHLLVAVEAVALEMRARGLDVHVRVGPGSGDQDSGPYQACSAPASGDRASGDRASGDRASGDRASGADGWVPESKPTSMPAFTPLPVAVVAAVARAVREALGNVVRHAGTTEAWVDVHLPGSAAAPGSAAPGSAAPQPDALIVTVRDRGAGFDPGRVGPDRLGISRSIVERMEDCGGTASVRSAPGHGTTVTLRVPAAAAPAAATTAAHAFGSPRASAAGWRSQ